MSHHHRTSAAASTRLRPEQPGRREWLRGTAGLGLASALGLGSQSASARSLAVGKPAPPLVLHALDGKTIATHDLAGQVVILAFWATWCEPCCLELPVMSAYAKRHAADGLRILGFSLDDADDLPKVRQMAADLAFPVGLLGGAYAGEYGRIWTLPVSFVVDRQGRLAHNGWDDKQGAWTTERLQAIVDPLLAS